jgi:hypothetical protein
MMPKMSSMPFFTLRTLMWFSLCRRFASLFSETRVQDIFAFLHVFIDGAKTTSTGNSTVPFRGVKQGFSLFINDVDDEFGSGCVGAVTGTERLRVTHMLYADDLTLTANDPVQLQKMLRRLESYATRKGLTVNVQKSYTVSFNAYQNSAVPVFRLYNQELEERDFT